MSGHSKWAQIKRQKGTLDVKKGATFTKLSNAISISVRDGGGVADESNFKLRLAIEKARSANMPKENIQRAIDRGLGKGEKGDLEEVVYEGFGPGGFAVMIECVTDNKLRTLGEITAVFNKNGGTLGQQGTVAYQFKQVGLLTLKKEGKSIDDVFLLAADAGADDIEDVGEEVLVYTEPGKLKATQTELKNQGLSIVEAELFRKPTIFLPIGDKEAAGKAISFVEKLEALDDVQKVYVNFELSDELL